MQPQTIRGITPRTTDNPTPETVVIFRVWKDTGEVIALFPEIPADLRGLFCDSYQHIGQHGAADYQGIVGTRFNEPTRPATPEEYQDLKRELESNPYCYRLKVQERATPENHAKREAEAKEMRRRMTS